MRWTGSSGATASAMTGCSSRMATCTGDEPAGPCASPETAPAAVSAPSSRPRLQVLIGRDLRLIVYPQEVGKAQSPASVKTIVSGEFSRTKEQTAPAHPFRAPLFL